ncbi:MAG: helix-turn-helix domain-containing protein [Pseudolabrys sp.]|nr:helix-turn-helix domain-containing protein [Pseudolabrys sp.]MDP2298370.1 helix-turn-helix domain-containing protein [Pseudolabrys sp.]
MDHAHFLLYKSNMPRTPLKPAILSYNLFGEVRDLPDVVHCETIAARSVLHDWEFAPHRHARLHQVLLIARGGGRATLEGRQHRLRPMNVVNVPAGQVHGFSFTPGTQGWVVTLASETLDEVLTPSEGLGRALSEAAVLRGTPAMRRLMTDIFAEHGSRDFARAHVLKALSATLLGLVARALTAKSARGGPVPGAGLIKKFEAMLDDHYLEHWPVAQYANALKVTPTHLSRLTREAFGCPASHMIRDRVVREARRNLVYTNLPIATIAYALGFDDPAYFSRTFTLATGLSPSEFRERVHSA